MSLALTPFSRVSASSADSQLDAPPAQDVARAGVSVVRLIASYTMGSSDARQHTEVQCTGLGVLVGSWPSQGGNDQNTWILTDGSLVNESLAKNPATTACGSINGPGNLSKLEIFLNTSYNAKKAAPITINSGLENMVFCQDTTDCSKGAALFSFNDNTLLPYVDLIDPRVNDGQPIGIGLTRSADSTDVPQVVNRDVQHNPLYAQTSVPQFLTPRQIAANNTDIEMGTPLVDSNGFLISMHLGSGSTLSSTEMSTFLRMQPALQQPHQNLVHDNWNNGVTNYFQHHYIQARNEFQQVVATNTQFQGASYFAQLAAAGALQNVENTVPDKTSTGGVHFLNIFIPYWLISIIGLVLLVGILLLVTQFLGRSKQRRRFKDEIDEANRQATIEAQRIKDMEALQREKVSQQPTLLPIEPALATFSLVPKHSGPLAVDQRCPRCNDPLLPGARFCSNCRLSLPVLDATEQYSGALPLVPLQVPAGAIPDQPTIDMSPGSAPGNGSSDAEQTEPYQFPLGQRGHSTLAAVTRTNPGIKRQYKPNEDSLFAGLMMRNINDGLQQSGLFVIADGMGGHANGQNASRIAIQTIINSILPQLAKNSDMSNEDYKQLLLAGVQSANQAVHQENVESHGDMGTTMTGALIIGMTAYIANVGDSRTYLYRASEGLAKVTQDHSVVASLVAAGIIKPDDIYTHPKRNQIYRSLGERANVEIDPFEVKLQPNDRLLLCSDGLWDMVRDPQIEEIIKQPAPALEKIGDALIKAALDGGGEDNVSTIVVQATEETQNTARQGFQLVYKPDAVTLPTL